MRRSTHEICWTVVGRKTNFKLGAALRRPEVQDVLAQTSFEAGRFHAGWVNKKRRTAMDFDRARDIEDVLFDLECLLDEVSALRGSGRSVDMRGFLERTACLLSEAETTTWPPIGTKPNQRLDMYLEQIRDAASDVRCSVAN
ncbi:hypothetical protein J4G52_37620 [Burkholderia cenocepacia]|uniref:hypothetical protein n=1 Tax=Burkholderia cenocepacia TaxID=95486 RepID=UPI001AA12A74|nr:hypothetical protein [Burkholderia cenocepacia]MBO1859278.1 hypothetical protein [Burkholderia cenocepacia]